MQLLAVNDDILEEVEIDIAVLGLKGGRAGGPSGIRAKDLKGWRQEVKRKKDIEDRRWEPVVRLVQVMFRDRTVPEDIYWETMVFLSKGKG